MTTFKSIAYQILKEASKPLHSKEITKRALKRGLVTEGKTPEATMNAVLITDINTNKEKSRFIKTAPSTFSINPDFKETLEQIKEEHLGEKRYTISKNISSKQKGDIAEARIAELITLYGETSLSCYKPISDDEGIDLIVKEKNSDKTVFIQVKSVWRETKTFVASVKKGELLKNKKAFIIFCMFDTCVGDLWDYVWFIPIKEFTKSARYNTGTNRYVFVSGLSKRESNKWDQYMIDKRDLASEISNQMKTI